MMSVGLTGGRQMFFLKGIKGTFKNGYHSLVPIRKSPFRFSVVDVGGKPRIL